MNFDDLKESIQDVDIKGAEEFLDLNRDSFEKFLEDYNKIDEETWEKIREADERELGRFEE